MQLQARAGAAAADAAEALAPTTAIPERASALAVDFMDAVLERRLLGDARVIAIEDEPIGQVQGNAASLARVTLEDMAPAAPVVTERGMGLDQACTALGLAAAMQAQLWQRTAKVPWLALDEATIAVGHARARTGLESELRRAHLPQLLRHYHRELTRRGVTGLSLPMLRLRYRQEQLSVAAITVLALATVELHGEEARREAEIVGARIEAALADARVIGSMRALAFALDAQARLRATWARANAGD